MTIARTAPPGRPVTRRASKERPARRIDSVRPSTRSADLGAEPAAIHNAMEQKVLQCLDGSSRVLVTGLDVDHVCQSLRAAGCLVSTIDAEGTRTPVNRRFDAIALLRALEHATDPVKLLTRLGGYLRNDGFVVAAVPNVTHGRVRLRLLSGDWPSGVLASGSAPPVRLYDRAAVSQVFERAGLVITQWERCTETFDCDQPAVNGTPLPRELAAELLRDEDALTAVFIVIAHKLPLTGRTALEIRVRELVGARHEDRRLLNSVLDAQSAQRAETTSAQLSQQGRLDALGRSQEQSAGELDRLKRIVDLSHDGDRGATHSRLRSAHAGLVARQASVEAVSRQLQRLQYEQAIVRIRTLVDTALPKTAVVLVVSKGDARLLELHGRTGWHFLQNDAGLYAGHHPADSVAAIDALERLKARGAQYVLFPYTAFWWLDHYAELRDYLNQRCRIVLRDDRSCVIYSFAGSQVQVQ